MNVKDMQMLYDYNYWANEKIMQVVEQLEPEEFTREVGGAYGSIRNTLVHMLSAEWGWFARCGGPQRGDRLKPEDFPSPAQVKEAWQLVEQSMRDFLSRLSEEDLPREVNYLNYKGETFSLPMGDLLLHAAAHNVHHRGQVSLMLREIGRAPGNIDPLFYYEEKRGIKVW